MALNSDKEVLAWAHAEHEHGPGHEKGESHFKLDKNGLPLVPQPSSHKADPLV